MPTRSAPVRPSTRSVPEDAPAPARVLFLADDPDLLDDLLRLAAVAGIEPEVGLDAPASRSSWTVAPLVVVGASGSAGQMRPSGTPRRGGVILVTDDECDGSVWEKAVACGAEEVLVLPRDEAHLVDLLSDSGDRSEGRAAALITVVGGRGGAGASTVASALALCAARRRMATTLIDADPLGGGLDMLLGAEDLGGARWPDLGTARGRITTSTLHAALPKCDDVSLLSWDRGAPFDVPGEAMHAVLAAARRGDDLVVADLPRRFDAAAEVALTCSDVTLLVVPAEVRAAAAAGRIAAVAGLLSADLRLVVRGPGPAALPAEGIAAALGLPLAGEIAADPSLPGAAERGEPPVRRRRTALSSFCESFLDSLAVGTSRAA